MRRYWLLRGLKIAALAAIAVAVFGLVVMGLWNWLTPALFGWKEITFWQAIALLVLGRLLLGGFRGPWGRGGHWRHHMQQRWEQMTPEEREKFRAGFQGPCGRRAEPASSAVQA